VLDSEEPSPPVGPRGGPTAWALDGAGGAQRVDEPLVTARGAVFVWGLPDDPQTRAWLEETAGLDPGDAALLLAETSRPRVDRGRGDALLLVIPASILSTDSRELVPAGTLRIWANPSRVIVIGPDAPAVGDVRRALAEGRGPCDVPELLASLADRAAERTHLAIGAFDEDVAELEEAEVARAHDVFERAVKLRGRLLALRRRTAAQRDALERVQGLGLAWAMSRVVDPTWRRSSHRTVEDLDRIDALVERAQAAQDRSAQRTADAINRVLYVVTLFTAIFTPLAFVAGLFGMNVGVGDGSVPGLDAPFWFGVVTLALILLGLLQLRLLRRLRPP